MTSGNDTDQYLLKEVHDEFQTQFSLLAMDAGACINSYRASGFINILNMSTGDSEYWKCSDIMHTHPHLTSL